MDAPAPKPKTGRHWDDLQGFLAGIPEGLGTGKRGPEPCQRRGSRHETQHLCRGGSRERPTPPKRQLAAEGASAAGFAAVYLEQNLERFDAFRGAGDLRRPFWAAAAGLKADSLG